MPNKPYEQALTLYSNKHGNLGWTMLNDDILAYAKNHFCYFGSDCLILAQVVEGRAWYIHLATGTGALSRFFALAPFPLEYVGFARPEKKRLYTKYHSWHKVKHLCALL